MTTEEPRPLVVVDDLRVTLTSDGEVREVLHGISLTIASGEIVAVVGESGSGKSVLGSTLLGLLPERSDPRTSGRASIADVDMTTADERTRRRVRRADVGVVFQDPMSSLNPTMTVRRQVAEAAGSDSAVDDLLAQVGLEGVAARRRAFPHELSGGQRQRVMVAMAIARSPRLIIADEPTTALDVTVQAQILELVLSLRDRIGCAFLFITHDLGVAAEIADRIVVMSAGRVVEEGPAEQILRSPADPYTVGLLRSRLTLRSPRDRPLPVKDDVGSPEWPEPTSHSSASPAPALRLDGIGKRYGRRGPWAVRDFSLEVSPGEAIALVGESGSGKSTVLRMMGGLIPPTAGVLDTSGATQMVFQDATSSLTPWLSIRSLLAERLRRAGVPREQHQERIDEALVRVGLEPELQRRRPRSLSGGQAQRAALARVIVVPPAIILADEPTSALDVSLAANVLNLLGRLRRELGLSMVFVTHDLAAARVVADRIVVLRSGAIEEIGSTEHVIDAPTASYTRALLAAIPGREAAS